MSVGILVSDLMFRSQILEVAKSLGVGCISLAPDLSNLPGDLTLLIVDLQYKKGDALALAAAIKERLGSVQIIAFCSHVEDELMARSEALGFLTMPRSKFSKELRFLLQPPPN